MNNDKKHKLSVERNAHYSIYSGLVFWIIFPILTFSIMIYYLINKYNKLTKTDIPMKQDSSALLKSFIAAFASKIQ